MKQNLNTREYLFQCIDKINELCEKGKITKEEAAERYQTILNMAPMMFFTEMVIPKLKEHMDSLLVKIGERIKELDSAK